MRRKWFIYKWQVLPILMVALFVLVTCQKVEQLDKAASTLEAELIMTVEPEPSPSATEQAAEKPAEEPSQEAVPAAEPTSSVALATTPAEMEEFVSATEFFSVKVPAGWSSEETFPGGAFVMANSESALERYQSRSAVEPGDFVLNVGFLPFTLFKQREVVPLNIQMEATPDVFLQSLLPMFNVAGDAVLGDVTLVSTGGERDAGMLTISDDGREGMILMFVAGDGVVALISTVGYPGEMAEFQDLAYAVAAGVIFNGGEDALYGTFLSG